MRFRQRCLLTACALGLLTTPPVDAQSKRPSEGTIPRIERMPDMPEPYRMRNWRQVTQNYVDAVFDFQRRGDMMPLVRWNDADHRTFFLPSYVGGGGPEAINCLAAVVSGSLIGLDMTRYRGQNWVKLCQAYYNNADGVYTNNVGSRVADSFWYELFPNILFYQLADRYPDVGDTPRQFRSVADRWQRACLALGARSEPQVLPGFDCTSFRFESMSAVDNGKWREPDGAAGIAWLEYMAYVKRKEARYLAAADLCLKAMEQRAADRSPLYEVLLPYGALTAARMNAELGRNYDVDKLVNWCFEAGGEHSARWGWGAIADRFGRNDCFGLIGSVTDTDGYAFAMNTFEWAGALTPIARYDTRYACPFGKWMLNLANASRLFYADALPADRQDSRAWADRNDPAYCLAYEGLRRRPLDAKTDAVSPYATGDAMRGNGPSNFCLYGGSHVGILGGIVGRTSDEKILMLDLLKTDYFHARAYPTYLLYNPYRVRKTVRIAIGNGPHDLYDAVSHRFVARGVKGQTPVNVAAGSAIVLVAAPQHGRSFVKGNRRLVEGVVVDYACNTH